MILENHLHLIASSEQLGKEIGDFKSYTARKILEHLEERKVGRLLKQLQWHKARHKTVRAYQRWQEGSHPEQIQNEEMMRQKLEYIDNNPVVRGYVSLSQPTGGTPLRGTTRAC